MSETSFTDEQLAVWARVHGKGLSDDELKYVQAFASSRGLNPLSGHFIVTRRWDAKAKEERLAFMTTIHAARAIASSTGQRDGETPAEWLDPKGNWVDVWPHGEPPLAARITVFRKGHKYGYRGQCNWADYIPRQKNGQPWPHKWWGKSGGAHMLAKCAENMALGKAFPEKLGGLYIPEEMDQAEQAGPVPDPEAPPPPESADRFEKHRAARTELQLLVKEGNKAPTREAVTRVAEAIKEVGKALPDRDVQVAQAITQMGHRWRELGGAIRAPDPETAA